MSRIQDYQRIAITNKGEGDKALTAAMAFSIRGESGLRGTPRLRNSNSEDLKATANQ
jgi:hypothetical protein